jgi:signal transduction histidine kinase
MKGNIQILLLVLLPSLAVAQDTTITITPKMLDPNNWSSVSFGDKNGWIFRQGNDTTWAKPDINTANWKKLKPTELTDAMADKNGKLEGWFRIKIKLDSTFGNTLFNCNMFIYAPSEMFVDGQLFKVAGNTRVNGGRFREDNYRGGYPAFFNVEKGKEHLVAIHFVDFLSPLPPHHLKLKDSNRLPYFFSIAERQHDSKGYYSYIQGDLYRTIWLSVNGILCLLFWFLAFQNRSEKNLVLIATTSTISLLMLYCVTYDRAISGTYLANKLAALSSPMLIAASIICTTLVMLRIFRRQINLLPKILMGAILICGVLHVFISSPFIFMTEVVIAGSFYFYYIVTSWKALRGAQWAIVAGFFSTTLFALLFSLSVIFNLSLADPYLLSNLLFSAIFFSGPLSLSVYVSMRFKEIMQEVRENSQKVIQLSEEKKEQALNQQKILQEEVNRQTAALRQTLDHLKATQAQLIQSEKMASLGELTAGIAHEIQNPLNFVNNFSDVNTELLEELKDEIDKGNIDEVKTLANDVIENQQKINQHGKRADAIVKGMLQHSRASSGKKEATDINALADEYVRLAYHGLRAKDKDFNATIETDFDESIGKIEVVAQDIGRVLLNLFNNAFYAVSARQKAEGEGFKPIVKVETKKVDSTIEVVVKDNGNGIPENVINKIFQPFFTTKPTGQGTGLGLSLSYDIIKAHGGKITVNTKEGDYAEFVIQLPKAT